MLLVSTAVQIKACTFPLFDRLLLCEPRTRRRTRTLLRFCINSTMVGESKKRRKKRGGSKRKLTAEQGLAQRCVSEWVCLGEDRVDEDGFGAVGKGLEKKVVFELHSHSNFSDGYLSPTKLVEKAHGNGVKVLALTDHDTMSGIPEAVDAASRFGIKIIPGVEISTIFSPREESELEEPVHVLAYYSGFGPKRFEELENMLSNIRDGRYLRAKDMVTKLNNLKLPLKLEHVSKIAGNGVAPGRLHVARAMVEAGHVENLKQAFAKYLYDGGPAYSTGSEPLAEEAVQLICETGGVAVLAHPWALKNPAPIVRRLKEAGLHGIEVYRSDGQLSVYSNLADTHDLIKLGGSDFHGRGGHGESALGSVSLPVLAQQDFLKLARPIWCSAIRDILGSYAEDPSDLSLCRITRFGSSSSATGSAKDLIERCLSLCLTSDEKQNGEFEAIMMKLSGNAVAESTYF